MASLPTPTIVRIKRRLGSETSETILISAKRKKLSSDEENDESKIPIPEVCTTIFKKLTTLRDGDSIEIATKNAFEKEPKHSWDLKENFKIGCNLSSKDLIQKKSKSEIAAIRFKLVCAKRNLNQSESEESSFQVFDAMKELEENALVPVASSSSNTDADVISCNGMPMESEKVQFVYDLYYTSLPIELNSWISNICEIERYNALDYRDESSKVTEIYEDDSDENSESNWRNDYPDEDDPRCYNEDDSDEDYLRDEFQGKMNLNKSSDESYDAEDYDYNDESKEDESELLMFTVRKNALQALKNARIQVSSSDESEKEPESKSDCD